MENDIRLRAPVTKSTIFAHLRRFSNLIRPVIPTIAPSPKNRSSPPSNKNKKTRMPAAEAMTISPL